MAELIWDGKYDEHGNKRAPVRIELPFQTVETVNESAQERQRTLELSSSGHDPEWRNRLIWGDKKYVLPSLLPEFAGKVDLIYIDPPFDTGADFSYNASIPTEEGGDERRVRSVFSSSHQFLSKRPTVILGGRDTTPISNGCMRRRSSFVNCLAKPAAFTFILTGAPPTVRKSCLTRYLVAKIS